MNYRCGGIRKILVCKLAIAVLIAVLGACDTPSPTTYGDGVFETSPMPSETLTQEFDSHELQTAEPSPIPNLTMKPSPAPEPIPSPTLIPSQTPKPIISPSPVPPPKPTTATATESAPTQLPTQSGTLDIVSITSPVSRNEKATLKAKGKPDTEYNISVYYSSGVSKAAGLEKKKSDTDGNVSWTWKIGGKTKSGNYKIVITGGDETKTVYFDVA